MNDAATRDSAETLRLGLEHVRSAIWAHRRAERPSVISSASMLDVRDRVKAFARACREAGVSRKATLDCLARLLEDAGVPSDAGSSAFLSRATLTWACVAWFDERASPTDREPGSAGRHDQPAL